MGRRGFRFLGNFNSLTGRLARPQDRVLSDATLATLRILDAVVGPEPETSAVQQRARDRERIERAFPEIQP
jgi:hypothetical protein